VIAPERNLSEQFQAIFLHFFEDMPDGFYGSIRYMPVNRSATATTRQA